jgi:hypothetical protein
MVTVYWPAISGDLPIARQVQHDFSPATKVQRFNLRVGADHTEQEYRDEFFHEAIRAGQALWMIAIISPRENTASQTEP